ncbi:signal peptidase II [Desulfovibrio inopinatus]|uniref:signal peptidase II n=1 Tax=Desulfovibrio inopinatus TaxID=102109 RepID=UPI000424C1BF|nr:signal peptidase II [Desulfovibrio inopinatus]
MAKRYIIAIGLAVCIIILDQATKAYIASTMTLWSSFPVVDNFFNIVFVLNRGAAFGFLNNADSNWQAYFFIGITCLALVLIWSMLKRSHNEDTLFNASLGLVLGGAIGNLVDRIRLGEVIDFLDFQFGSYHWPAFNVADIAITTGALLLALCLLFSGKDGHDRSL